MTWTKLDDGWNRHPKILGLSRNARLLWVDGLTYCNEQLTDGFIPLCAVSQMLIGVGCKAHATTIGELCKANLWQMHSSGEGYVVHDFLEYNPSKCKVMERRVSEAKRKANARAARSMSHADSHAESGGESHAESGGESALPDPTRPDPTHPTDGSPPLSPPSDDGGQQPTEPPAAKQHRKKPATTMPDDWAPTESNAQLARELGRDLQTEAAKFRDYCHAHGKQYAEWGAAFGNWLRNDRYRGQSNVSQSSGNRPRTAYPVQSSGRGFQAVLDTLPPKPAETQGMTDELPF